jgi:glycosyltransferase involved in cell wall biosynthesis
MTLSLTFVVCALNEEVLIADCLRSIQREAPAIPIFLVDNGSTDRTVEIARRFSGVYVISEPKRGLTRARQAGLDNATTDWVAFIDADCKIPDGWMTELLDNVTQPDVVAVSGPPVFADLSLGKRVLTTLFYIVGKLFHFVIPMLQGGNFVINRVALQRAGGFDTSISFYGEDTATAVRLSHEGKLIFSLDMYTVASARRMTAEGFYLVGLRYAANYFWMWIAGRPLTRKHSDHREELSNTIHR